jgi:hypothetical protein
VHGSGLELGKSWFMVADNLGGKRGEQPRGFPTVAEGAFRIFDSGVDRLCDLELFRTLFTTIFVKRHVGISCCSIAMQIPAVGRVGRGPRRALPLTGPFGCVYCSIVAGLYFQSHRRSPMSVLLRRYKGHNGVMQEERIDDDDRIERYMRLFEKDDVKKLQTGVKVFIDKDEWQLLP